MVNEPSAEDAISILKGIRNKYEEFHCAKITDEAIKAAVKYLSAISQIDFYQIKPLI